MDAYFWIKHVGKSDGSFRNGAEAEQLYPDYALGLVRNAEGEPAQQIVDFRIGSSFTGSKKAVSERLFSVAMRCNVSSGSQASSRQTAAGCLRRRGR